VTALSDRFRSTAERLIERYGAAGQVVDPNAVYATEGSTTEVGAITYDVRIAGPVDDARRWAAAGTDSRVTATFYVGAGAALAVRPAPGWRVLFGSRVFTVHAAFAYSVNGVDVAHRLDCGETGA
jgi:hypothetical protein